MTATTKKPRARRVVSPPPTAAPPSEPRATSANNPRIQVAATPDQERVLDQAAEKAGYGNKRATGGRSAWMLKVSLQAAHAELSGQVVVLAGEVAETLKAEAARDGLTVEQYLERSFTMARAVRASAAMSAPAVASV